MLGICLAAAFSTMLQASPALAQSNQGPGAIERTIPNQSPEPSRPLPSISAPSLPVEAGEGVTARFTLGAVTIEGATVFLQEELSREFEPYLATEIGESELKEIAERITRRYQNSGYLLSYAYVPSQDVRAGIVRIAVVEGRVGDVVISGTGEDGPAIQALALRLVDRGPLKIGELERTIGLIRDLPGFAVIDASLAPTADRASHVLKLAIARDRMRQILFADNRGPEGSDRVRLYSSTSLSSLAVAGDELRFDLFAIPTRRYRYLYGQIGGSVPIGRDGLRLGALASAGDLSQRLDGRRIDGESSNYSIQLSYPILRTRLWKLVAKAAVNDLRNVSREQDLLIQRDRLRVARIGMDFGIESRTRVTGDIVISRGLGFDAGTHAGDPLASRLDAGGRFTKAAINVQVVHPVAERVALNVVLAGQLADRPLLLVEEFALGGSRIGRAYDFNAVTGDRGIGGAMEIAYRLPDSRSGPKQMELFAFVDGGIVGQAGQAKQVGRRGLASIGAGSRLVIGGIALAAEIGFPLVRMDDDRDVRAFLTVFKTF